jgi:hypothetical protein
MNHAQHTLKGAGIVLARVDATTDKKFVLGIELIEN